MNENEEFIGYFRQAQPKFSRFYAHILTEAKLSLPQYALLNELVHSGTVSMTELSERLHITKPAVTHLVDRLEKNKCLKRLPHPEDRRVYLLEIQPRGENIVRTTQAGVLRFMLKALAEFSGQEKKVIGRFYREISKSIEEALSEGKKSDAKVAR